MVAISDTSEKVVVKIDVQVGATGNLLELARKEAPSLEQEKYVSGIQPLTLPDLIVQGTMDVEKEVLLTFTLFSYGFKRKLELVMNKETSQYEITRNDFNVMEIPDLKLLVLLDLN